LAFSDSIAPFSLTGVTNDAPNRSGDMPRYEQVSGALFGLIAIAQLTRAVLRLPAQVGTFSIPVWFSFVAFGITGGLAIWAFQSAEARRRTTA
jgi:hypothetical protein